MWMSRLKSLSVNKYLLVIWGALSAASLVLLFLISGLVFVNILGLVSALAAICCLIAYISVDDGRAKKFWVGFVIALWVLNIMIFLGFAFAYYEIGIEKRVQVGWRAFCFWAYFLAALIYYVSSIMLFVHILGLVGPRILTLKQYLIAFFLIGAVFVPVALFSLGALTVVLNFSMIGLVIFLLSLAALATVISIMDQLYKQLPLKMKQ